MDIKGEGKDKEIVPEMISAGQVWDSKPVGEVGKKAVVDLMSETAQIIQAYDSALEPPWSEYLDNQRQWADTVKVRTLEAEGDDIMGNLNREFEEELVKVKEELRIRGGESMRGPRDGGGVGESEAPKRYEYPVDRLCSPLTPF